MHWCQRPEGNENCQSQALASDPTQDFIRGEEKFVKQIPGCTETVDREVNPGQVENGVEDVEHSETEGWWMAVMAEVEEEELGDEDGETSGPSDDET